MIKKIEGSIAIAKILNKFKIYIDALIVNKWQILLAGGEMVWYNITAYNLNVKFVLRNNKEKVIC